MTIDTNIVIAYLGGEKKVIETLTLWQEERVSLFLSTVVEAEILSFSDWTEKEKKDTEKFLEENFTSIPFDRTIARITAKIRRQRKIKFPDAAIAATAIFTKTPVVTRNIKDFRRIQGLKIVSL